MRRRVARNKRTHAVIRISKSLTFSSSMFHLSNTSLLSLFIEESNLVMRTRSSLYFVLFILFLVRYFY